MFWMNTRIDACTSATRVVAKATPSRSVTWYSMSGLATLARSPA
jgi:hypothetical protein